MIVKEQDAMLVIRCYQMIKLSRNPFDRETAQICIKDKEETPKGRVEVRTAEFFPMEDILQDYPFRTALINDLKEHITEFKAKAFE